MHPVRWLGVTTLFWLLCSAPAQAQEQERIYRCGNVYTNLPQDTRHPGCVLHQGGHITTVNGTVPQPANALAASASASGSSSAPPTRARRAPAAAPPAAADSGEQRVGTLAQRARDNDAKAILETEMRRAQERLAQAQQAYAQGEPEKQGIESRNHQRYLDRVAELKSAVTRAQGDVDSLRRELARLGGSLNVSAAP